MSDKILGIDYGTKRIGLALSDESGTIAFPREVLDNSSKALEYIKTILVDESVGGIVMGESRDNEGNENALANEARSFGESLEKISNTKVSYEPEFLSSVEADRALYDAGIRKQVKDIDAHAAAVILQRYLDKHSS